MSTLAEFNEKIKSDGSFLASLPGVKSVSDLTYACIIGNVPLAKQAINNGGDVNETDSDGYTPLHAAAEKGSLQLVDLLLQLGANRGARTSTGFVPADLARQNGHSEVLSSLE